MPDDIVIAPRRRTSATLRSFIAAIVAFATLALFTGVGVADQIVNDVDGTADATVESITLTLGATGSDGTVGFYVITTDGDGKNGCNVSGGPGSNMVATVATSDSAVATVSPSSVTFTSCGSTPTISVIRQGLGTAEISLALSSSTNTATFDFSPATFSVTVQDPPAPANTAPSLNLPASPVIAEAISPSGAAVTYTATATDAEDDPDPTPVCLPASGSTFSIGTTAVNCTVTDGNGATTNGSFNVLVRDTTNPVVSITTTATQAASGWYNIASSGTSGIVIDVSASDAVGVSTLSCLDGASPLTLTSGSATLGDGQHAISCTATDGAGNNGSDSETFKVDQTAPTMTATLSPTANTNGWNNTGVIVSYTCTDATSGIDPAVGCPSDDTLTTNGVHTLNKSTADLAGNAITPSFTVRIDQDAPTISGSASPAANADGWNNTDVTVSFTCADSLSTIDTCSAPTTLGEGAGQSVTGTAKDKAGNTASATVSNINVDKTAPTIGYIVSGATGSNGWYVGPVTVTFNCTDGLSGVKTLTTPITLSSDGASQSATGTCVDKAGNSSSATASGIDIDASKPVITVSSRLPAANTNGWNNGPVTVAFECNDVGPSGIETNTVAGGTVSTDGENQSITNSGTCVDEAGNVADSKTESAISIDTVKPVISGSASPAPNGAGWNNTDVLVSFECIDALSGIDSNDVAGATLSSDGADQSVTNTGSCSDKAGNVADSASVSNIDIDKTKPSLNISGAAAGTYDICTTGGPIARPTYAPSDALSGLDGTEGDSWSTPGTASGVGAYTYSAHAEDNADNTSSETRVYNLKYGSGAYSGVYQPINRDGTSRFKLGSTIPVKFSLTCGTTPVTNAVAALTVAQGDTTPNPGTDEAVSTSAATTGNLFRYDATGGQYIFNLSTKQGYKNPGATTTTAFAAGTWTLGITLDDGAKYTVVIQLVR